MGFSNSLNKVSFLAILFIFFAQHDCWLISFVSASELASITSAAVPAAALTHDVTPIIHSFW